jgi:excisionase family DNA binding protein
MTLKEAAERLGVSPSTLRVQLWKGKLRGTKRGRDWWITPAEVARYAAESGRKVGRCPATAPKYAGPQYITDAMGGRVRAFGLEGQTVRCEDVAGHPGEHFHSFYMRHWEDESQ